MVKKRNKSKIFSTFLIALAVVIVAGGLFYLKYHKKNTTASDNSSGTAVVNLANDQLPAVESGVLPWTLQNPISRLAVFDENSSTVLLAGGYNSQSNSSSKGVYSLSLSSGALQRISALPNQVHDMAYASLSNGSLGIFGGGSSNSTASSSVLNNQGSVNGNATLPQARSDASAVTVGSKTYIIGGYNGQNPDGQVLVTSSGQQFTNFSNLVIPIRYSAVGVLNNLIYVFGGQAVTGPNAGQPINSVQVINTTTGKTSLAKFTLPVPLSGGMAFTINNQLYLAGGLSNQAENITPGLGTTQIPGVPVNPQSLTQNTIWAFNSGLSEFQMAGTLQLPVANAGVAVVGNRAWIIGGEYNSTSVASVQMIQPNSKFGIAGQPGAGLPYYGGHLMIADRGNNRILVLNSSMKIVWKFPSNPNQVVNGSSFYFPDDAFFANHGTEIISNQENNNTVVVIGYPSGKILWTYGHPLVASPANGYLSAPDDAYLLKNNTVVVADDQNCRVLFINFLTKAVESQIGTTGVCVHNPNVSLGYVNGDTPLFDGNVLLSEIRGSWVSEYTPQGKMVWTTHLPISYPSDPQQIGASPTSNPNKYLIADYSNPGAILEFTRQGQILSRYQVASGQGMLNYPSLVELLPSGVFMANDDHNHRMVAIDPATSALVWQYGITGKPGTAVGQLHKPDGFDILLANGTTPTHLATK